MRREKTPVGLRRPAGPVRLAWFIPTREAWQAGERWIRCDLHVAWSDPTGALTASLRGRYDEVARTPSARSR